MNHYELLKAGVIGLEPQYSPLIPVTVLHSCKHTEEDVIEENYLSAFYRENSDGTYSPLHTSVCRACSN